MTSGEKVRTLARYSHSIRARSLSFVNASNVSWVSSTTSEDAAARATRPRIAEYFIVVEEEWV